MKIAFETFATVRASHAYYAGPCRDLHFAPTPSTQRLLEAGRMLARMQDGALVLLYETDGPDPLSSLDGETLFFGIHVSNQYFSNITEPVLGESPLMPCYVNDASATAFDPVGGVQPVSGLYSHPPSLPVRPVVLTLKTEAGDTLDTRTLVADQDSASYDFRAMPDGFYTIDEAYDGGATAELRLLRDSALFGSNAWGVLALRVTEDLYGPKTVFTLAFTPREERLRYYVVADNFDASEFNELNVVDDGNNAEGGVPIVFSKVVSPFPDDFIDEGLLKTPDNRVAVFESQSDVPRRERGLKKLQLNRNSTTLIQHLPLPGPEKASADLIVHLSKP